MSFVPLYRVWETTATSGAGAYTLAGAVADDPTWGKFIEFGDLLSNADTCNYVVIGLENGLQAFEVGLGTYTTAGNTLARTTILKSYSDTAGLGTGAVNWDSGDKQIYSNFDPSTVLIPGNNLSDVGSAATALSTLGGAPLAGATFTGNVTLQSAILTMTGLAEFMKLDGGATADIRFSRVDGSSDYAILINMDKDNKYTKANAEAIRVEFDQTKANIMRIYFADGATLGRAIGADATIDWVSYMKLYNSGGGIGIQLGEGATLFSTAGGGAPSSGVGVDGDFYFEFADKAGTANRIYVKNNVGTWEALST